MLLIIAEPESSRQQEQAKKTSFMTLIMDPYILLTAGEHFVAHYLTLSKIW